MTRETYIVRAKRWDNGWELHIDGPRVTGVTQTRGLKSAERMARDYIALDLEEPADSFDVTIIPEVGGFLGDLIKDAKTAIAIATEKMTEAANASREAVTRMHEDGMSQTEISQVLHVSQQRVSQLLRSSRPRRSSRIERGLTSARRGRNSL